MSKEPQKVELYIPVVSEAIEVVGCVCGGIMVLILLFLMLAVFSCTSNAIFGWPRLDSDSQKTASSFTKEERERVYAKRAKDNRRRDEEREMRYHLLVAILSMDKAAGDIVGNRMYSFPTENRIATKEMREIWERLKAGRGIPEMLLVANPPNRMSKEALFEILIKLEDQKVDTDEPPPAPAITEGETKLPLALN